MAKWLKDYLNFGTSRRDAPQPPRPDYIESDILKAYRVQKDLDFEDPYQSSEKTTQNGSYSVCTGTLSLPSFPPFDSILSNGVEVKVVSPKHRLIKVDSQEFGRCNTPLSPVAIQEEIVVPSAPTVGDLDTDYSDPFDARPDPCVKVDWEHRPSAADFRSYMEPFEAQRIISELQHSQVSGRPRIVDNGGQLYDNPYEEKTRQYHRTVPPKQGGEGNLLQGDSRESRLPQDDERPADEYDQPWEWKKDNISKALAVQFEGAEWDRSLAKPEQTMFPKTSPTSIIATGSSSSFRKPSINMPLLGERVDPLLPLERQVWYHGALSRPEAETLLTLCKESSYLVRNSQSCRSDYSLSLRSCKGFMHMKFTRTAEGHYVLGENSPPFFSIPEVIHYYTTHKLPIRGAEHLSLLYPVIVQTL